MKTFNSQDIELDVLWRMGVELQFFSNFHNKWLDRPYRDIPPSDSNHCVMYRVRPKEVSDVENT